MKPPSAPTRRDVLAAALGIVFVASSRAQSSTALSDASTVSVAVSVALPVALVAGVGSLVVTGVEASADGVMWLVETIAEGVQGSIRFAAHAVGATLVAVGTVIAVTVVATGMLLSSAGRVIAFIPNEVGHGLSYNQRVSQ